MPFDTTRVGFFFSLKSVAETLKCYSNMNICSPRHRESHKKYIKKKKTHTEFD